MDKKISVIIPIYNAEKYLAETLNSVRFQTYKNLEIVCVLDCPPDSSENIINKIAKDDERIKIVCHAQNMGPAAARNTGVKNANGEYLHFMDADDLLSPDFYEIMVSSAEKNSADVSACSVYYEKKPWKSIWFKKNEILTETADKIEKTEVVIRGWAWRYLIKKSFWIKQDFSFPDLMIMEDTPVMIPMIYYANKVAFCPSATYFYMRRESSILNKKNDVVKEKKMSEHRHQSRKMCADFMREKNIKRPCKLLYDIKKFIL
jgi:glycosyltransferase involved in cell wall biosynthesis